MSQYQAEFHGKFSIEFHGIPWGYFTRAVTKLGIMGKFGQSNMLGIPALHSVYAKSHPQPLMNDLSMTRKSMANCPGRWCAGQKECSSSVIVGAKVLKTLERETLLKRETASPRLIAVNANTCNLKVRDLWSESIFRF